MSLLDTVKMGGSREYIFGTELSSAPPFLLCTIHASGTPPATPFGCSEGFPPVVLSSGMNQIAL